MIGLLFAAVNWTAFGAVATALTGLVIVISVVVLVSQLRQLRLATHAQAYDTALTYLQNESIRETRRQVFALTDRPLDQWSKEDRLAAEKVCHTYDIIAIMVRNGMLPERILVDSWQDSLWRSWRAVEPLVSSYREQRNFPQLWDDFKWLAEEAIKCRGSA